MKNKIVLMAMAIFSAATLIISCTKDSTDGQTTTLQVRLTDAPTNYEEVNVDIREVKVKFTDDTTNAGWVTLSTHPGIYNLLAYQNGIDTLLATGTFPTQVLKEIRFILGPGNSIKDSGVVFPLTIPSGAESGLKIKADRSLNATLETIIIDFDAALSVHKTGNGVYMLRPVLRIR